ncbi:unnamed protein product [Lactuca saligna]|uniref:Uncharacterized protein n=1 Tax=Lactuca saligna TaxID=75948 RepID=A0AA35VQX2_LACSI|nr:unnamed protein product [Lactuca saligna]
MSNKKISITSSNPISRYTDRKVLASQTYQKISITSSNPISRYTDRKVLASQTYQAILEQRTSFARPYIKDGKNCSWWMIDLGSFTEEAIGREGLTMQFVPVNATTSRGLEVVVRFLQEYYNEKKTIHQYNVKKSYLSLLQRQCMRVTFIREMMNLEVYDMLMAISTFTNGRQQVKKLNWT